MPHASSSMQLQVKEVLTLGNTKYMGTYLGICCLVGRGRGVMMHAPCASVWGAAVPKEVSNLHHTTSENEELISIKYFVFQIDKHCIPRVGSVVVPLLVGQPDGLPFSLSDEAQPRELWVSMLIWI